MQARVEKLIPKAIEVLEEEFGQKGIPKVYNGYIATFGASIIQSGLKATLALFENAQANTQEDRALLTKLILRVLDPNAQHQSLLRYILEHQSQEELLKEKIRDIAIALKLALRTFELIDKEKR